MKNLKIETNLLKNSDQDEIYLKNNELKYNFGDTCHDCLCTSWFFLYLKKCDHITFEEENYNNYHKWIYSNKF